MEENSFRKDFFIEIIQEIDTYSARKLYNMYFFTIKTSIHNLKEVHCNLSDTDIEFSIKIIDNNDEEFIYKSESKDRKDKKIYKFIKKYIEREKIDYNIIITNVMDVFKHKQLDFLCKELFKTKITKEEEGCKYEF
jgi:hypothetical protein